MQPETPNASTTPSTTFSTASAHTSASASTARPRLIHDVGLLRAVTADLRLRGNTIGFVPTMGALHLGHRALMREARKRADVTIASIFVNPKQFSEKKDLARYPRVLDDDCEICAAEGIDIVFAPAATELYPAEFQTIVKAGRLADDMEGAHRPGHFDGVLTVVNVLLHVAAPHFAVFGEKDFQQLAVVRRMVDDLRLPVDIVPLPVVRDTDGLALSSRNRFLTADQRRRATCLYRAIMAAQDVVQSGVHDARAILRAATKVLTATRGFHIDYVEVRDPRTLRPVKTLTEPARILVAGRLGTVRLLDNAPLFPGVRFQPPGTTATTTTPATTSTRRARPTTPARKPKKTAAKRRR